MRNHAADLAERNIAVVVVTFDSKSLATQYRQAQKLEWPILLDESLSLYRAYGMPRAGWWALSKPLVFLKYLAVIFGGTMPGTPGRDLRQMGGNVLVDPQGNVVLNHVSETPHDRPSFETVVEAIDRHARD